MRTLRGAGVVLVTLALWPARAARSQVTFEGCTDIRGIPVASVRNDGLNDVAMATLASDGSPIIVYNVRVLTWLRPQTRLFFYAHECGHHALGHNFGTAFPKTMEQEADCWGINALFTAHRIRMRDVAVIQGDISRAGRGDWTHLPGPVRATNLRRCIESEGEPDREVAAPPPPPRTFCCDSWGRKRCEIPPMRAGSPCYCVGIPGVGSACY